MKLSLAEIIELASKGSNKEKKIELLRQYDSPALRYIFTLAYHPEITWALPEGAPPYTKSPLPGQQHMLYTELRRLYLFLEGGNPNLKQLRRETLFVQILEAIDPKDAELLIAIKDRKIPYKGITKQLVSEAFPDLLPNEQDKQAIS